MLQFWHFSNIKDNLSVLLPYYYSSKGIKEIIKLRGPNEKIKFISKIYPFNSQIFDILWTTSKGNNNPLFTFNGYIPLRGEIAHEGQDYDNDVEIKLDSMKVSYICKLSSLCHEHNVKLIMIISPEYFGQKTGTRQVDIISKIAKQADIERWDYECDSVISFDKSLFKDQVHLNHRGATLFTETIVERIKHA